jgi:peptide/nickel transport system permease protein
MATNERDAQWEKDLDNVGLVRRLFRARKWYGMDWWLVVISFGALATFVFLALFPQLVAPYDPRAEVGPSLLAPGETSQGYWLVARTDLGVESLRDVGTRDDRIGFVVGSAASHALRDATDLMTEADRAAGLDVRYTPRPQRFDTLTEALYALDAGEIQGVLETKDELAGVLDDFPNLTIVGPLTETAQVRFIFGTNQIGQDVFSRIVWGTRIALFVGIISAIVAVVMGVPIGLISGFIGGPLDRVLTLVMDSLYSFPGLILAIAIAAVLGPGIMNIIVAIAVLYVPTYFRIVRGQTLTVKEQLYIEAAHSLGANRWSVLWHYVFPNVIPSIVVIFSVNVADAILTEAGLSFIGLGLPPDTPDWGIDLARGQDYLLRSWWLITVPGLMVTLVVLSFSMLGESLSEILNPRLNRQ